MSPKLPLSQGNYQFRWPDPSKANAEVRCVIIVIGDEYTLFAYSFDFDNFDSEPIPHDSQERLWKPLGLIMEMLQRDPVEDPKAVPE